MGDGNPVSLALIHLRQTVTDLAAVVTRLERAVAVTPSPVVSLPPFSHPMAAGYFYRDTSAIQYGGDRPESPCTVSVIIDPLALPAEPFEGSLVRMIISEACLGMVRQYPQWWDMIDAVYLGVENDEAMLEQIAGAVKRYMAELGLPPWPMLAYTAGGVYPNVLTPSDILGVQLYVSGTQGPDDVRALAAGILPRLAHRRVALICQAYDRSGTYTGDLAALQPVYAEIAEQWRNVEYILWFSDGRKGGTRDHEEIRPWHMATVEACR